MHNLAGRHLIIRTDASSEIGTGHLMRCLSLAQAWKDAGDEVIFITSCQNEGLLQRLREEDFEIHIIASQYSASDDWEYTKEILADHPDAWVVLDGYHLNEVYQQHVKESGHRLLVIDDMAHLKHYYADIVLNQNLNAEKLYYPCEPYTRLLMGTNYALLRREFLAWRDWKRDIPKIALHVLVTLGGGDPTNHTLKVIKALQKVGIPDLEAVVVVGAGNPHYDLLKAEIKQSNSYIHLTCDANNMPELMAWADVAVSGAGITIWELLFLETPILALILADNQSYVAEPIELQKAGRNLGRIENISDEALAKAINLLLRDFELRTKMSCKARNIVDGKGTERMINSMLGASRHRLRLRPVRLEDCQLLWQWSNEPVVRAASFNSEPISWEAHIEWFNSKLNNPDWYCYIFYNEKGLPIGQVRVDTMGYEAEISISISSDFHGSGYGAEAIHLASEQLFRDTAVKRINAYIKQENTASILAFTKANYKEIGVEIVKGHPALQMVLDRKNGFSENANCEN